jgi:hypothetical protein
MTTKPQTPMKLVESPDPAKHAIFGTPHEHTVRRDVFVMTIESDGPGDGSEPHVCGNCGQALIKGPVEGRLDSGIVIQCPVCRAYNKATD